MTLPESITPSHYLPRPPEYTPLLHHYVRHCHNLSLPHRIYRPLNIYATVAWNPPLPPKIHSSLKNIYASLSDSTPPSKDKPPAFFYNVIFTESPPDSRVHPPPKTPVWFYSNGLAI